MAPTMYKRLNQAEVGLRPLRYIKWETGYRIRPLSVLYLIGTNETIVPPTFGEECIFEEDTVMSVLSSTMKVQIVFFVFM